ncbi:laminin subunit beta-4-like isoform X1 [Mya arenaria]|uniref:laminin subunit beta-4-like isoform X1 n=2 Tax=Mya arenaria TaxID=6604 RepID=UPI0022E3F591|nr:laminin subunit beta-4-like isoform X1 [Mya arenaria]
MNQSNLRHLQDRMMFWIFVLLCLARSCKGVFINGLDCNLNCVCCKGGVDRCGYNIFANEGNFCFNGCVDGIFGNTCHNACHGNCSTCNQAVGRPCYSCKAKFYDTYSLCSKRCSVGCYGGVCNDDGTCSPCLSNFEGKECETCIQGKYGSDCTLDCTHQNCRCSTGTDCTSCKMGFYGRSTFCQTSCSPGCLDGVCNDKGSCICRAEFTGITCSGCQPGHYGAYCNISCSVGNCQQGDSKTSCNIDGDCLYGCINDLGGKDCSERRIYIGSPTNVATAALSGVFGILLICTAAGCYLWNRRRSSPSVSEQENQRETVMTYEQLQRQTN